MGDLLTADPISPNLNSGPHPSGATFRRGLPKEEQGRAELR